MSSIKEDVCWSGPAAVIVFTLGRAEVRLCDREFDLTFDDVDDLVDADADAGVGVGVDQGFALYLRQCLRKASRTRRGSRG